MDRDAVLTGPLEDLADPATLVTRETAFSGRVWDIVRDTVTFGGSPMTREYMSHSGAVVIAAIDGDGRLLLINQYRQPIATRSWELPAGLLDVPGENPLEAAKRELAEEADLLAADWRRLVAYHPSAGGSDELITVFVARDLSPAPDVHERTDEEAEIVLRWEPVDAVVAAIAAGRLRNGPLIAAALMVHAGL
ncbi:NUDIX domain-containing protein [Pseudolysinimonas sp.]|jgi:8-oxo-dGTP pyrophosphatase MutT (NUDIX family)|uniref:NUDIX domain-containing protein n=1 Tax=Pseudolysinimonas sp. TaxID=2680009 RepID=UPI003783DC7C